MPILDVASIADLAASTLADLQRLKISDLTLDTPELVAFNRLFQQARMEVQSGTSIKINLVTAPSDNSRFKGLYEVDPDANQDDALSIGDVPWRFGDWWWAFDINEIDINSGVAQIQDYARLKRFRGFVGWADFVDAWWFDDPPSASDKKTPYNLKYWLQKNVTATGLDGTTGGGSFSSGMPSGHSTIAGIDTATDARFQNYTYKFTDVTEDDLLVLMRTMVRQINFMPPQGANYPSHGTAPSHEHLVPLSVLTDFERLAENRNDNLGYDFSVRVPTFGRAPFTWCPRLDSDTDVPIYTMDWGVFKTCVLKGMWLKEFPPREGRRQHTVVVNWVDSRWNVVLFNRRRCAVGAKAAANA